MNLSNINFLYLNDRAFLTMVHAQPFCLRVIENTIVTYHYLFKPRGLRFNYFQRTSFFIRKQKPLQVSNCCLEKKLPREQWNNDYSWPSEREQIIF